MRRAANHFRLTEYYISAGWITQGKKQFFKSRE
jgi:hypothetical protein